MPGNICTIVIILINVIVFIMIRQGRLDVDDLMVSYHEVYNLREPKRILTAAFAHADPIHLMMNMLCLYDAGSYIERLFGHMFFLLIYFASLIFGKLLALQIRHSNHNDYLRSLGASGAICGLIGCELLTYVHYFGFTISVLRSLLPLMLISFMPGVDGTSHFSCMAVGMAITYLRFLF